MLLEFHKVQETLVSVSEILATLTRIFLSVNLEKHPCTGMIALIHPSKGTEGHRLCDGTI